MIREIRTSETVVPVPEAWAFGNEDENVGRREEGRIHQFGEERQ